MELCERKEVRVYDFGKYQKHDICITKKFDSNRQVIELPEQGEILVVSLPD